MYDADDREMALLHLRARIAEARAAEAHGWADANRVVFEREQADRADKRFASAVAHYTAAQDRAVLAQITAIEHYARVAEQTTTDIEVTP